MFPSSTVPIAAGNAVDKATGNATDAGKAPGTAAAHTHAAAAAAAAAATATTIATATAVATVTTAVAAAVTPVGAATAAAPVNSARTAAAAHATVAAAAAAAQHTALRVVRLRKAYAAKVALDELSFTVMPGEVVGLLGPNGAGKTTTINMILGVLQPTSGSVRIAELDLAQQRARALARTNFAAVYAALPGNLTVLQNLRFFGLLYGIGALGARIEELLHEFDLVALRDTKCGLLSSGEQTRAALAKALLNKPALLLLDEPTASLDPSAAQLIRGKIKSLATQDGCGILWTSHNMAEVEEVCDRVIFLSHGKVLLEGDPRTLPDEHGAATLEDLFIRVAREPLRADSRTAHDPSSAAPQSAGRA